MGFTRQQCVCVSPDQDIWGLELEPTVQMSESSLLLCILDDGSKIFSVHIDQDTTAGLLKRKMKEESPYDFRDVHAAALTLYEINVRLAQDKGHLEVVRAICQDLDNREPLEESTKMSDIIEDPTRLQVFVKRPEAGESSSSCHRLC